MYQLNQNVMPQESYAAAIEQMIHYLSLFSLTLKWVHAASICL